MRHANFEQWRDGTFADQDFSVWDKYREWLMVALEVLR